MSHLPLDQDHVDVGFAAQQAAEKHLAAVWEAEEAYERAAADGDDEAAAQIDSPASAPFDGCDTCVTRETLHAAWPVFHAHVVAQLREAGFDDAAEHLVRTVPA